MGDPFLCSCIQLMIVLNGVVIDRQLIVRVIQCLTMCNHAEKLDGRVHSKKIFLRITSADVYSFKINVHTIIHPHLPITQKVRFNLLHFCSFCAAILFMEKYDRKRGWCSFIFSCIKEQKKSRNLYVHAWNMELRTLHSVAFYFYFFSECFLSDFYARKAHYSTKIQSV